MPKTIDEQKSISDIIDDLENLITKLRELIQKKKLIRQGLLYDIFFLKKMPKGFSGEWKTLKFSEMFDVFKGQGLSKEKVSDDGEFECILYGELFTKYQEWIDCVISKTNYHEGKLSVSGDVLMPGSTTTEGKDLAIASTILKSDVLLGGDIVVWRPKIDFDSRIVSLLLPVYVDAILPATQGITIVHLKTDTMKDLEVCIPMHKTEQTEIVNMFVDFDSEIQELEKKLVKYQSIRQGVTDKLFTGEVRLQKM